MDTKLLLETIGTLTKVEDVDSIQVSDWLVIENSQPYPGYHSQFDADAEKPRTLFFITKERIGKEILLRKSAIIRQRFDQCFDATPCQLTIYSDVYHGIRIKYLKNFSLIPELMRHYNDEGISFRKYRKISAAATITIFKYFSLEEISKGIYQDLDEKYERYVEISQELSIDVFVKLARIVRNNMVNNNFDAALAVFHRKHGIVDAVRVFESTCTLERLKEIQREFELQLRRLE
ncbi:hypothetical protein [Williamwhitmania taraxaci]|uniref:Uncharacterized protein n=1 Tax=Williamwhitmania taraxaci TaxID=1640674 RepID=A0A1G6GYU2_9BACT|nr:hypothetical protein [Williamwhitmania taraxaci]SDB87240.1 hypothetical protein SAMN05216323_100555 [Williamwhitmania taraxaci]